MEDYLKELRAIGERRAERSGDMMYRAFNREDTAEWKAADEIERLRDGLGAVAVYLDELQANLLRNDVDMMLAPCKAPEVVASELRALAGIP